MVGVRETEGQEQDTDTLTGDVIGAAIDVHRELGPGLLEKIYHEALISEFDRRGLTYREEVDVPVKYKGRSLEARYRLDLLVEEEVVVEVKAVQEVRSVHQAQLLTYLELTDCSLGLLLNFHEPKLVDGIRRMVR